MAARILIAFATKHGSTREVAQSIGETLTATGADVDVVPAHEVDSVDAYDAVVLGGSIYLGRWHKQAQRFLSRHRKALDRRPLAIYALGPQDLTEAKVAASRAELDRALQREPGLAPVAVAIFGGVIDPAQLSFPFNRMPASDARDWHAIDAWAEELAALFAAATAPTPA